MSAIGGMFYWDRRPVPDSDVALLAAHNHLLGEDGGGTVTAPGLAMQSHLLAFDALSATERQPHAFASGSILTWDGRLDNRDDLTIAHHHDLGAGVTDAALVAAAYVRWGLDCLRRVVGDWSLAIWDEARQQLVLACDYMGNRPLYYVEHAEGIAWSTSISALVERFDRGQQPDDDYIAGRLTFGVPPGVTPFRGVRKLPGGHSLVAGPERRAALSRYWTFEPTTIRYRRQSDYDDRLRELLTDAVRVRLRADRPVWAHLSGGWDSSSIVCLAQAAIARGQAAAPGLQPISLFDSRSPESDERVFVKAVEAWCGLSTNALDWREEDTTFADLLAKPLPYSVVPADRMAAVAAAAGSRVVLSGTLGDLTMFKGSAHRVALLEPLRTGHPGRFLKQCLQYGEYCEEPLVRVLAQLAPQCLPAAFTDRLETRRLIAMQAKRSKSRTRDVARAFGLTPRFFARTLPRPLAPDPRIREFPRLTRFMAASFSRAAGRGAAANSAWARGAHTTFPYVHRPLVEFVLGVPPLTFWAPDTVRAGMKRALQGVLPPAILERDSKGQATAAITRRVRPLATELVASAREWKLVTEGYLDHSALSLALRTLLDGSRDRSQFVKTCLELEAWLRTIERSQRAPAVSRPMPRQMENAL
jgi:asparagine synthase (glutamine-hydrolysing)